MDAILQPEWILFAHSEYHRQELLRIAEEQRLSRLCQRPNRLDYLFAWLKRHRFEGAPRPIKPAVSRQ